MERKKLTLQEIKPKEDLLGSYLITLGFSVVIVAIFLLFYIFHQAIFLEAKYTLSVFYKETSKEKIFSKPNLPPVPPVDKNFAVIVPKINVNTKVLSNVDPYDKSKYDSALLQAAAHAKGTALPGEKGNIFLFAHSVQAPNDVARYNAIFYLLNKVTNGDEIYIIYKQKTYKYKVTETKIISPEDIQYLENNSKSKTVTLMTCWPAGIPFKRLLVIGKLI